jgi:hypothetical protein
MGKRAGWEIHLDLTCTSESRVGDDVLRLRVIESSREPPPSKSRDRPKSDIAHIT